MRTTKEARTAIARLMDALDEPRPKPSNKWDALAMLIVVGRSRGWTYDAMRESIRFSPLFVKEGKKSWAAGEIARVVL